MRLVIQRVAEASVRVEDELVGAIGRGMVILVGVREGDTEADAELLAQKAYGMRIFQDAAGKMNLSAQEAGGDFLAVSQFTLYADTSRGRRPSFIQAAGPQLGERLYERFVDRLRRLGGHVETGRFGAMMLVQIANDGPVTIIVDSDGAS